jgi:hypothetical protein
MTAFVKFSDDIRLNLELNQPMILVLLDFSKAFDSVCHGLFILKLRQRLLATLVIGRFALLHLHQGVFPQHVQSPSLLG